MTKLNPQQLVGKLNNYWVYR